MNRYEEAMKLLEEKLGHKDGLISLSTIALEPNAEGLPHPAARLVDAYYEDGAFYTVTNLQSGKMRQIAKNPHVAICPIAETFTADGVGENLGWVCDEQNVEMMAKLRVLFAAWYHLANNDNDHNTVLLRVRMTKGLWFDGHTGTRSEVDFVNRTVD